MRTFKMICVILCCLAVLAGCGTPAAQPGETEATQMEETTQQTTDLNGKKFVFIGDSFTFTGRAVLQNTALSERERRYDTGYFYQICKANGDEVTVSNWTVGGKSLEALLTGYLPMYSDYNYDYVVISSGRNSSTTYEYLSGVLDRYIELFRKANPDVKFVFLVTSGAHNISIKESFPIDWLNNLDKIEEKGFIVVDWGKLVADLARGEVSVPGGTLEYNNYSFVHHKSETDGFHPNQLAGYITALMTYCAITGESAQGQTYDFWCDASLSDQFNPQGYYKYAYTRGDSNYQDVFASSEEMAGIQKLIDQYLADKAFRNYNFTRE